jgi:hypothetical protein
MRVVFDLEVYSNYFLAMFVTETGTVIEFSKYNDVDSCSILDIGQQLVAQGVTLISFNGRRYDIPLLSLAVNGADNATLKKASDEIILDGDMWWIIENRYGFSPLPCDHIDIINLLPLYESLKMYGARRGTEKLQDLPFDPKESISDSKAAELRTYCRKDCQVTWELFVDVWPDISLRETLGVKYDEDLRSRSDAQIAEAVMMSQYMQITGTKLIKPIDAGTRPKAVIYKAPAWVSFKNVELTRFVNLLELEEFFGGFKLNQANGKPDAPEWLKKMTVMIGGKPYAVGLGGLHAQNKSESYFTNPTGQLLEIDVQSFYPRIILNEGYEPPHMRGVFGPIYESLVDQRLSAKADGDKVTADGLKITINGCYGKLGSPYSAVYAPELMLGVTFTGQLALLMLIEMMAYRGIQCVSANTDGIVIVDEDGTYKTVVEHWEVITGFVMETTFYDSVHYRDVNNYFARTPDGTIKRKGCFKPPGLDKNPAAAIIYTAAIDQILNGIPVSTTIYECEDIKQFLQVRKVNGGAAKDGEYLGKAIRWYYSEDTDTDIKYISNGNKVALSDGGMPMMDLVDFPDDLDFQWYVGAAEEVIAGVGYEDFL